MSAKSENKRDEIHGGKTSVIDMTPTWEEMVDIMEEGIRRGNEGAKKEFRRMARLADKFNRIAKVLKAEEDNIPPALMEKFLEALENK